MQFLSFALVGCVGFAADTGVLLLLARALHVGPLPARVASFLCAASLTFWLNRRYTFRARGAARLQWLRYVLATGLGAAINIGVYYAWVTGTGTQAWQLVAGSALGSIAALAFNYLVSRSVVFADAGRERR